MTASDDQIEAVLEGGYHEYRPSWWERFQRRLGYGYPFVERPEPSDAWPSYIMGSTTIYLTIRDRLLLLLSGRVGFAHVCLTDVVVGDTRMYGDVRVLWIGPQRF